MSTYLYLSSKVYVLCVYVCVVCVCVREREPMHLCVQRDMKVCECLYKCECVCECTSTNSSPYLIEDEINDPMKNL